ncbi:MAG: trypsin-like peptidase domain-containing protein [Planctomycetes bacterium]|nr:trypsin-like peptidase domain-containing protein [Planctomycetota bacterium]
MAEQVRVSPGGVDWVGSTPSGAVVGLSPSDKKVFLSAETILRDTQTFLPALPRDPAPSRSAEANQALSAWPVSATIDLDTRGQVVAVRPSLLDGTTRAQRDLAMQQLQQLSELSRRWRDRPIEDVVQEYGRERARLLDASVSLGRSKSLEIGGGVAHVLHAALSARPEALNEWLRSHFVPCLIRRPDGTAGTGLFVDRRRVLTALHVLEEVDDAARITVHLRGEVHTVTEVVRHDSIDLALLDLDLDPNADAPDPPPIRFCEVIARYGPSWHYQFPIAVVAAGPFDGLTSPTWRMGKLYYPSRAFEDGLRLLLSEVLNYPAQLVTSVLRWYRADGLFVLFRARYGERSYQEAANVAAYALPDVPGGLHGQSGGPVVAITDEGAVLLGLHVGRVGSGSRLVTPEQHLVCVPAEAVKSFIEIKRAQ